MSQHPSRRDFLKAMGVAATVAATGNLFSVVSAAERALAPTAAVKTKAKAKAVIQIWMWGGPSHIDTFDPKPEAGYDYTGSLDKTIETNVPGIKIISNLPMLAQQADKYSIVRSMTHGIAAHETAAYMMQTGHQPGVGVVYPSAGAIVSFFKGYNGGYSGLIPPYVVLTESQGRFAEEGFLGPLYKPFATGGDPNASVFAVNSIISAGITDKRQNDRRGLLHSLDTLGKSMPGNSEFTQLDQYEDKAYELILGESRKVFDLSAEPKELRDRYGRNKYGQSCLQARRLVEAGIPYITINYGGWDTHKRHFETMATKLPEFDKATATLLQDLSDRGLLDSTIVWIGGEFGRTPNVLWEAPWYGGRGHYGNAFSVVLAGGGFKGGRVVGATDDRGISVVERPVYPQDLIASIFELLGIDPNAPLPNPLGMDLQVMPSMGEEPGKGRLREIM